MPGPALGAQSCVMETNIIYRQADMEYRTSYLTHRGQHGQHGQHGRHGAPVTVPSDRRSHRRTRRLPWRLHADH